MKYKKAATIIISAIITVSSVTSCLNEEEKPVGAVNIDSEEIEIIETMQEEGAGEIEITEALIAYEDGQKDLSDEDSVTYGGDIETTVDEEAETPAEDPEIPEDDTTDSDVTGGSSSGSTIPGGTSISSATPSNTPATEEPADSEETYVDEDEYYADDYDPYIYHYSEDTFLTDEENKVIQYINELRKQRAVEKKYTWYVPIVRSESVTEQCHTRCYEIVDDFSHSSASGISLGSECIYMGSVTDNIAYGVYNCWYNSAPHLASLLGGCTGGDQRTESINAGIGILRTKSGSIYAVHGHGSYNFGTPPSSGYELAEGEHMHHYDTYVRSERYDTAWMDIYACSCGEEMGFPVDVDPCTNHYGGEHEWSEEWDWDHYAWNGGIQCCVCLRCGAHGVDWGTNVTPEFDYDADIEDCIEHSWAWDYSDDNYDYYFCVVCGETRVVEFGE